MLAVPLLLTTPQAEKHVQVFLNYQQTPQPSSHTSRFISPFIQSSRNKCMGFALALECCWCTFSLLYLDVAELLEEYQGGWLGQRGDLCRGQEEAGGVFVQGKGCGTKNLSCAFLNSGSHLTPVVCWSCMWTFFCGTANNCIYRLKSAQSATCQPQL